MRKKPLKLYFFRKLNEIPKKIRIDIFFFIKFNSYTCLSIIEINEIRILIYEKIKPGNPRIFQNIPRYIPYQN